MKWVLNLSTRAKLVLGFGLMVLFLAIVIAAAYRGISAIQESQKRLYQEGFVTASDLQDVRNDRNAVRADLLTMMFLTKRSEQEAVHQQIKERSRGSAESMQRLLKRTASDPQLRSKLEELEAVRTAFRETREAQIIPLIYQGKIQDARKLALGIQEERHKKMRAMVNDLVHEAEREARATMAESELRAKESVRVFVIAGALALAVGLVMVGMLNRVIAAPLTGISGLAGRVASGDLTVDVPATARRDEVGVLAQTFRTMVEGLRELNRETRDAVNVLGSAAAEILATTTQVASGAAETAAAVSETTTTVEEVKQTAQAASQKAKYVSESAQRAAQISQAGRKAVEETIGGMNRIREQMESVAESIVRLSEQSQAIGEIIATVSDLAEQSNLLAVNAAIEAAKAGEQGKGFAVVAQEVRRLAEQSKQATAQVRTILNDVQKATSGAVMATEQGSKAVAAGVKQSTEAGESIRVLAESVAEAAQAATQIAASSQQQVVGMDQVALAMENIKQASAQNVAGTRQTETAARSLHELGQKLKQLVERYKV